LSARGAIADKSHVTVTWSKYSNKQGVDKGDLEVCQTTSV